MKQGGRLITAGGFTIVETMIVLAVTGLMFVSAAFYISGKQDNTQFFTAANNLQQQLQQVINETASGYPGNANFSCTGHTVALLPVDINPSGSSSTNCVFVGKALQFGVDGDDNTIGVWPLVGNQQVLYGASKQQVQDVAGAHPTAAYSNSGLSGVIDASASIPLENGLKIESVTPAVGGMAIVTSFGSYGVAGLNSGSQQFTGYKVSGTTAGQTKAAFTTALDLPGSLASSDIKLCAKSGTTDKFAVYTISADSLDVSMQVKQACT